jgi:hypothetical protein
MHIFRPLLLQLSPRSTKNDPFDETEHPFPKFALHFSLKFQGFELWSSNQGFSPFWRVDQYCFINLIAILFKLEEVKVIFKIQLSRSTLHLSTMLCQNAHHTCFLPTRQRTHRKPQMSCQVISLNTWILATLCSAACRNHSTPLLSLSPLRFNQPSLRNPKANSLICD